MERDVSGTCGAPSVVSWRGHAYEPGSLVYGEIATDEVVRPGQRMKLWLIVTNVGDTSVSESVRMHVRRAGAGDRPVAIERDLDLTVPPGEIRVAAFDVALDEIAIADANSQGRQAAAASGEFEITVATTDGECRRARVRLAEDGVGELAAVA